MRSPTSVRPAAVGSVALSNDGNCVLASCLSGHGRLTLLEKASGEVLNSYVGHTNTSYQVGSCFTNTDAYVASGSEDGTIVFWDLVEVRAPARPHTPRTPHPAPQV
jgi:mitogen-activated protein kinase organizer 1